MPSTAASKVPRPVRIAILILLLANLLDLTTSLFPTPADHLWPIPPKPGWLLVTQCGLVVPLVVLALRARHRISSLLGSLPIPRSVQVILGVYLTVAVAHVLFRSERYPFSPVTMFSSGVPEATERRMRMDGYALMHSEGVEVISWLREGNVLFARHQFGFDYKAGWVMHMYAYSHSTAKEIVEDRLAAEGAPSPRRVRFEYRRDDGRLWLPEGRLELP